MKNRTEIIIYTNPFDKDFIKKVENGGGIFHAQGNFFLVKRTSLGYSANTYPPKNPIREDAISLFASTLLNLEDFCRKLNEF